MNEDYYNQLDQAFSEAAFIYDYEIFKNKSSYFSYLISLDYLLENSRNANLALDIGCGTGLQAIPLALKGIHVVAIDVSEGMLNNLIKKKNKLGLGNIEIHKLPASRIDKLIEIYGQETFDLAYSFFGSLNAEPNLERFSYFLFKLLKKNSKFIAYIINRWCLYDALTLKPRKINGIYKNVKFKYFNPIDFQKYFRNFKLEEIIGLGVIFPHRNSRIKNEKIIRKLTGLEIYINRIFPFKYLGTDFIMKFIK